MPERKNNEALSLNGKKLLVLLLVWKTNRLLQYGSLFFIMRLTIVRIWRDNLPFTKFFLVLTTDFGASILFKNSLMHLSTKPRG